MSKQPISLTTPNLVTQIRQVLLRKRCCQVLKIGFILLLITGPTLIFGQDLDSGIEAIEETADSISGFFDPIETVVYVLGGIIALLGAIRVFSKWQMGDQDVMATAAAWFGSAIFLIVAITIIKSFFDIG